MARIPINNKSPNTAGYTVLNTDTGRIETFSDGSFKVVSGIDVSTQEYTSGYNKILIDGVEKLLGSEVVEEGSNDNGNYIKYENGTLIMTAFKSFTPSFNALSLSGFYETHTVITFPTLFIDISYEISIRLVDSALTDRAIYPSNITYKHVNDLNLYIVSHSTNTSNISAYLTFLGRWK